MNIIVAWLTSPWLWLVAAVVVASIAASRYAEEEDPEDRGAKKSWAWFVVAVGAAAGALVTAYADAKWQAVQNYPGLLVAMTTGFFGATFSMLVQSSKRATEGSLDDLRSAAHWPTLVVRASVGLGAASILYFFFESELLGGNLWPDLKELDFHNGVVPNQHWCLLIIWSFVAGFSETFVPNILHRTEEKVNTT